MRSDSVNIVSWMLQLKNLASEKIMESIFLDYMMSMFAKQNQLGTKDEYVNHLLDGN